MVETNTTVSDDLGYMEVLVPIRQEYLKEQAFEQKINSRLCVAIFLSFFGKSQEVGQLMQTMSHKTRAYYQNVQGFPGFVVPSPSITELLSEYLQG